MLTTAAANAVFADGMGLLACAGSRPARRSGDATVM
jgi:hypothetical protein